MNKVVLALVFGLLVVACVFAAPARPSAQARAVDPRVAEIRLKMAEQSLRDTQHAAAAAKRYVSIHGMPNAAELNPVLLVPGLGGSNLEAQLEKSHSPAWYCASQWDWFHLWLALDELVAQPCFFDNMYLQYFPNNNSYSDHPGVQMRPYDFGSVVGIDSLDVSDFFMQDLTAYYLPVTEALEGIGYVAGKNLFGVPYDWRLPVDKLYEKYLQYNLTDLIETAYSSNKGLPVHLITHSMGGPTILYYLNHQPESWVQKYVASFTPIAGPWTGAFKSLLSTISGNNFGIEIFGISLISLQQVATLSRQSGGVVFLCPDNDFYSDDTVFVTTPSAVYTTSNYSKIWDEIGTSITSSVWAATENLIPKLSPPTVPSNCLYGYNVPTDEGAVYEKDFSQEAWQQPSTLVTTNLGDGTVPLESLQQCKLWSQETSAPVACREYNLQDHIGILSDEALLKDVLEIVTNKFSGDCTNTTVLDAHMRANPGRFKQRVML